MTWRNRFRLFVGLVTVLVVVVAATVHLNDSQARVASSAARVTADSYTVGTPYAGVVVDRLVEVDAQVAEGDPMFLIDSANLQRDLSQNAVPPRTVEENVDENGFLIVRASGPGKVTGLAGEVGTFVQESTELAAVQREGTASVEAAFVVTTQQYARLTPQATIVLPDGQTIAGEVAEFTVEDQNGESNVVAVIRAPELVAAEAEDPLISAGAPVEVELHLRNEGVVSDVSTTLKGWAGSAVEHVVGLIRGIGA